MNLRLGTWLSVVAFAHMLGAATPAFAEAPKPSKPQATPAPASEGAGTLITKGRELFEDQRYEESIQTLSGALVRPGSSQDDKVEILRLLALDYITLDRKEEAESAVRGLLVIRPEYDLPASESPRFRDFFASVRAKWIAEGRPGLVTQHKAQSPVSLRHVSPEEAEEGHSLELRAKVTDPDKRTRTVTLYYRSGTKGAFHATTASYAGGTARANIPGSAVKPPLIDYYFEALDASGVVLAAQGDPSAPLRTAVPESNGGWVLPVAIGGGLLGAAAVVGTLALAGVFKSSSSPPAGPTGPGTSTVTVTIGESSR